MSSNQYVATRAFATTQRQYEMGEMLDMSRITSGELNAGVASGAVLPARFTDTAANLASRNPVLGPGVIAYEIDTGVMKIGTTGVVAYNSLPQAGNGTFLQTANNLSEVTAGTARTNLGLGSAATMTPATIAADSAFTGTFAPITGSTTYGPNPTPVTQIRGPLIQAKVRYADGPANGAEVTLLDIPAGTSGVVEYIDVITASMIYGASDDLLRIYADGSVAPQFSCDLGTLFCYANAASGYGWNGSTQHISGGYISGSQWSRAGMRFPVPFSNGIRITIKNVTNSTTGKVWSNIAYRIGDPGTAWRLRSAGKSFYESSTGSTVYQVADSVPIVSINGGPGLVVYNVLNGGEGATSVDWAEREVHITIDGEGSPSIKSSGTEDFYGTAFNGALGLPDWAMGGQRDFIASWGIDLLQLYRGIPFTSSLVMTLVPSGIGPAPTTNTKYAYWTLYYQ